MEDDDKKVVVRLSLSWSVMAQRKRETGEEWRKYENTEEHFRCPLKFEVAANTFFEKEKSTISAALRVCDAGSGGNDGGKSRKKKKDL